MKILNQPKLPLVTKNESGFILATVVIMTLILSVVILSFMSLGASQSISGQGVVDEIVAEQLAIGEFHRNHQYRFKDCQACGGNCANCSHIQANLNGKSFTPTIVASAPSGAMNDTTPIQASINF